MSSRDELPSLDILPIKITEEFDARKESGRNVTQNTMFVSKNDHSKKQNDRNGDSKRNESTKRDSKMKCFKCGQIGHRAKFCRNDQTSKQESSSVGEKVYLLTTTKTSIDKSFQIDDSCENNNNWCTNLISIGKVTDTGYNIVLCGKKAKVVDRSGNVLITANRESGLYYLHGLTNHVKV